MGQFKGSPALLVKSNYLYPVKANY